MKKFIFIFLCIGILGFAQQNMTVSGYVYDMNSGESISGVSVEVINQNLYTTTNAYGFYSLSLPIGNYEIQWVTDDHYAEKMTITQTDNLRQDVYLLSMDNITLRDVVVEAKLQNKLKESQIGLEKMRVSTLNKLPVLLGERDVLKSIKLMPGLKSSGAGESGLSVRGGTTDQNLITLDDATVYNADHLLGFFSTFNSDAIKDVSVYKGTAPAEYGGRTSSFIDIRMKEGNNQEFAVNGGIGLIFSRLNVEGPIQKGVSSFLLSARRSYADLFLKATEDFKDNKLYFYDLNAKLNYKLTDKDHLFLSGYYGRDVLGFSDYFGINWGNITQTLRYNRIWHDKLFSNTSFVFSNFDFEIDIKTTEPEFQVLSRIRDFNLKHEFQYFPNNKNNWKLGISTTHHTNIPGGIEGLPQLTESKKARKALESALYISNDWKVSDNFSVNYGARLSHFKNLKGGTYYNFDDDYLITSEIEDVKDIAPYTYIEPRISMNYTFGTNQSVKLGYARNTQNLHLISNAITSSPSDRWIMSSNIVKPQISDQIALGYLKEWNNMYEFSVETYYKDMKNQIDFKDASDERDLDIEQQLRYGVGRAYGAEFLVKKTRGKLTGWLGYTWSKTEKKINGVNQDAWYLARQDRPHDISIVAMYELNKKWDFSAAFVYQTGNAVTYPTGKYNVEGQSVWLYTERNGYRMPDNHRLDIAATWKLKQKKNFSSELVFSIYNVYARENAFSIFFEEDEDNANRIQATQLSLFKLVPSISYNFKF